MFVVISIPVCVFVVLLMYNFSVIPLILPFDLPFRVWGAIKWGLLTWKGCFSGVPHNNALRCVEMRDFARVYNTKSAATQCRLHIHPNMPAYFAGYVYVFYDCIGCILMGHWTNVCVCPTRWLADWPFEGLLVVALALAKSSGGSSTGLNSFIFGARGKWPD